MFNVRLAGDHLYGKRLFTWLSLVTSLMVSILCCPFSHEMSWVRSGTELSQFLRILPVYSSFATWGGRVVRKCWVTFQCRGVLLIWITAEQNNQPTNRYKNRK